MNTLDLQEVAKQRFDFNSFKQTVKEKIQTQLTVVHNNGLFKATPELISLVTVLQQRPHGEFIYLEDAYGNPVEANADELLTRLVDAHQFAHNNWFIEFEHNKKIRKIDV